MNRDDRHLRSCGWVGRSRAITDDGRDRGETLAPCASTRSEGRLSRCLSRSVPAGDPRRDRSQRLARAAAHYEYPPRRPSPTAIRAGRMGRYGRSWLDRVGRLRRSLPSAAAPPRRHMARTGSWQHTRAKEHVAGRGRQTCEVFEYTLTSVQTARQTVRSHTHLRTVSARSQPGRNTRNVPKTDFTSRIRNSDCCRSTCVHSTDSLAISTEFIESCDRGPTQFRLSPVRPGFRPFTALAAPRTTPACANPAEPVTRDCGA